MARMMGVDVGKVRVGVALSDPQGILASPWRTLPRDEERLSDINILVDKILEEHIAEIYVGLPTTLTGAKTASAADAQKYAQHILSRLSRFRQSGPRALAHADSSVHVCMLDERMTTVLAHQLLHAGGKKLKEHRKIVDQVAAQEILQHAIESKRHQGDNVGIVVRVNDVGQ